MITLSAIILLISAAGLYFSKRIKPIIIAQINEQLTVKVEVADMSISGLKEFPKLGIKFTNVVVHESTKYYNKPILEAQELNLFVDLMKLMRKEYVIDGASLIKAKLRLADMENNSNYDIFKEDTSSTESINFAIEDLRFEDCSISYNHETSSFSSTGFLKKLKTSISYTQENTLLKIKGNLLADSIIHDNSYYLKGQDLSLNTQITLSENYSRINIAPSDIILEKVKLKTQGFLTIDESSFVSLNFNNEKAPIQSILSILPDYLQQSFSHLSAEGNATIDGYFKGKIDDTHSPAFGISYTLDQASLSPKGQKLSLENINAKGELKIEDLSKLNTAWVSCKLTRASSGNNYLSGDLFVENFDRPFIKWNGDADLDAKTLSGLLDLQTISLNSGRLKAKGKLQLVYNSDKNEVAPNSFRYLGDIAATDIKASVKDPAINIHSLNVNLTANEQHMVIKECDINYNQSEATLVGYIRNLDELFSKNSKTEISGKLQLKNFNVNEFISSDSSENAAISKQLFPYRLALQTSIENFKYNDFTAESVQGTLLADQKQFAMNDCKMVALKGKADAILKFTTLGDYYLLDISSKVYSVDITRLFSEFNNFEQTEITDKHISGLVSGTIIAKLLLDANYNPVLDKLYAKADVEIVNGQLVGYEPLKELSKFVELKDLENVKFKSLKNTIEIFDQTIFIPRMYIGNNAMSIELEGTHNFENYMNYNMSISLLELLAKKSNWLAKKKERRIEDNEHGGLTAYINMKGTPDDLEITYDKVTVKRVVNEELKEEKKNFIRALRGEEEPDEKPIEYYEDVWDE